MPSFRLIGPGRAGRSMAAALAARGWRDCGQIGRHGDVRGAASGVDLLLVATPDASIASVAAAVDPVATTVVAHLAGSLGLDVLAPHARRAAIHPLMSLPDAGIGAERLLAGGWFAIAGDPLAGAIVASFGGRAFAVADADRATYHAAACVAANHLVALLGQVERLAADASVPFDAFVDLARGALENVAAVGPVRALTGPVVRGDDATIERHLAAVDPAERPAYEAMVDLARRLVNEVAVP